MYKDLFRETEKQLQKELYSSKRWTIARLIKVIGLCNLLSEQGL